ncbi:MAG: sugar phosphate isomerase/epimerase family protein [Acidobacteriota bacterium]
MNRRKFLIASTGLVSTQALAAATAAPAAQNTVSNRKGLRLGTVTYNLARSWDIETIIKNCTETGFEGVELRSTHAHGVEIDTPPEHRKEVKQRFEDSPVVLVQLGSACEFHSPDPAEVRRNIEETKAFVKLAHDVGAPGVKVRPNGLPAGVPEEKTLEQIGRSLNECGAFASDHGVEIRLEIHGRETNRIPRIRKMMDYAHHDHVTLVWNCNEQDLQDDGFEANFNSVKPKIKLVHLRDLYVESYPHRKLVQMLKDMNYQGFSLAEVPESSDSIRVMRYYRALWLAYQGLI